MRQKNLIMDSNSDNPRDTTNIENDSLKDVIELVESWMADESGYDEETYPQIEAALNQNRV
ncbi:MAG: hypothetical protein F6K47_11580 [Symploca sp. SIO2E6]|nr:hypothetical protein [Symploca sp. SIO2E6]